MGMSCISGIRCTSCRMVRGALPPWARPYTLLERVTRSRCKTVALPSDRVPSLKTCQISDQTICRMNEKVSSQRRSADEAFPMRHH
jgi:hypothetical protein